jgi:hypothetical protein
MRTVRSRTDRSDPQSPRSGGRTESATGQRSKTLPSRTPLRLDCRCIESRVVLFHMSVPTERRRLSSLSHAQLRARLRQSCAWERVPATGRGRGRHMSQGLCRPPEGEASSADAWSPARSDTANRSHAHDMFHVREGDSVDIVGPPIGDCLRYAGLCHPPGISGRSQSAWRWRDARYRADPRVGGT